MIPPTRTETVLLVDDCKDMCTLVEILLCRFGYHVLAATNGDDAMDLARTTPEIGLLLTNLSMPGMRGDELAGRFSEIHPAAAVVFVTSFEHESAPKPFATLVKPFTIADLRATVRRALRNRRASADTWEVTPSANAMSEPVPLVAQSA
jgi:DNA-binding NtrC family response regulator